MDVLSDKIEISGITRAEDGTKLEPEERPAARVIETPIDLTHGGAPVPGGIPGKIAEATTVGLVANTVRRNCGTCRYFDRTAWRKFIRDSQTTPEGRAMVTRIMGELVATDNMEFHEMHRSRVDEEFDTDHALMAMGVCHALSEWKNDTIGVTAIGTCPDEVIGPTAPFGFYQPADRTAERAGNAAVGQASRQARQLPRRSRRTEAGARPGWCPAGRRAARDAPAAPGRDRVIEAHEIIPRLWMGSHPTSLNAVRDAGFGAVALCARERGQASAPDGLAVIRAGLDDGMLTPRQATLAAGAARWVANAVKRGQKVLVACNMGVNRSGLVTGLAMMRLTGCWGADAVATIQARRVPPIRGDGKRWTPLCNQEFADYLRATKVKR